MAVTMPFSPCATDAAVSAATGTSGSCPDVSVNILQSIFGDVITNLALGKDTSSITAAGGTSVIASMMAYFNSGVLTVAALIVSFVAVVGVINTANDGEAFGKNWSSLWTPMRIVSGAAVLLPTSSGYSFIQLFVMMISLWGIGFANGLFKIGVEEGIKGGALASVQKQIGLGSTATSNKDFPLYNVRDFAAKYAESAYCAQAVNKIYLAGSVAGLNVPNVQKIDSPDISVQEDGFKKTETYQFKDRSDFPLGGGEPVCGTVDIYTYTVGGGTKAGTTLDLSDVLSIATPADLVNLPDTIIKVAAYDQDAIIANNLAISKLRDAVLDSKKLAVTKLMANIDGWVADWPSDVNQDWTDKVSVSQFNAYVDIAQQQILKDLSKQMETDQTLQQVMAKYNEDITGDGWAMAGGYYQRLSGIREEMRKIYAEPPGQVTQPTMNKLPDDSKGDLVRASYGMATAILQKALDSPNYQTPKTATSITDPLNAKTLLPAPTLAGMKEISIDGIGRRAEKAMGDWTGYLMKKTTDSWLGLDGNADAIGRIKATGDSMARAEATLAVFDFTVDTIASGGRAAAAFIPGNLAWQLSTAARDFLIRDLLAPLAKVRLWLSRGSFYFGTFLPSLPYTIFIIAVVGWFLAVLQTVFAAPLWAVMHMSPERTFIGGQTQGYLMLLSLFMRPALIIIALFAAMAIANPVLLYVSKAFWAMRTANVTSSEASVGWFAQFFTWKNWVFMYGLLMLPVTYMIFGLTQALPDAILTWIGAGIKPLGETQATGEMRQGLQHYGASVGASAIEGAKQKKLENKENSEKKKGGTNLRMADVPSNNTENPAGAQPTDKKANKLAVNKPVDGGAAAPGSHAKNPADAQSVDKKAHKPAGNKSVDGVVSAPSGHAKDSADGGEQGGHDTSSPTQPTFEPASHSSSTVAAPAIPHHVPPDAQQSELIDPPPRGENVSDVDPADDTSPDTFQNAA